MLDVGCGSGVLSIAAVKLGFAPVLAFDFDPQAVEATERNAVDNGVEIDVRRADLYDDELPEASLALANIAAEAVEALSTRLRAERVITSGYLVSDDPQLEGYRSSGASRTAAGRRTCTCAVSLSALDGELLGPLPRLQGLADRRAGAARAAGARRPPRGRRRGRRGRRQHVLRHERRAREVAPGRLACGPLARARLRDRLRRAAVGDRVRRAAGERHRRARPDRAGGRDGRGRRRRDRLRPGGREARPHSCLRQDPGRLLVLLRFLRDPARPRRDPQPQRRGRAHRDPQARRARVTARSSSPASTSAASATARPGLRSRG